MTDEDAGRMFKEVVNEVLGKIEGRGLCWIKSNKHQDHFNRGYNEGLEVAKGVLIEALEARGVVLEIVEEVEDDEDDEEE